MKALCWQGVNELSVEQVPDPAILNAQDAIVKVTASTTCGSDLHLLGGYIPAMRAGDVIGHEFIGEIVDVGPEVTGTGRATGSWSARSSAAAAAGPAGTTSGRCARTATPSRASRT
nr:alcohol dehydrogenase catalytic domain-containing protein [Microbispora sp. GKU 823]